MKLKEVLECLCIYDERNPDYFVLDGFDPTPPRNNCYCDNCFYGRHELAEEILHLRELLKLESK